MKPCYAAALALVGWYLMGPPLTSPDSDKYETQAPLSRWETIASFDTAAQCTARLKEIIRSAVTGSLFLRCIATDDPRLKGN